MSLARRDLFISVDLVRHETLPVTCDLLHPLLYPEEDEREGYVPNVFYSCGSMLHGRELIILSAGSDRASAIASVSLDDLLTALLSGKD